MSASLHPEDSFPLAPLRYGVIAAKCDCCTDVTVHLAVGGLLGQPVIDLQFDRSDIPELIEMLQGMLTTTDLEGAIDGRTIAAVDWRLTAAGEEAMR